jgi:hypothetical protein
MLTVLAVVALLAAQAPAPPAPAAPVKVVPMTVQVESAATADAGTQAWVKELRAALGARKDEFRVVKPGEAAELVVRVDSVARGQADASVMNGALVVGKATRPFNLSYAGETAPQAEKLARNLRKLADQMKAAAK